MARIQLREKEQFRLPFKNLFFKGAYRKMHFSREYTILCLLINS